MKKRYVGFLLGITISAGAVFMSGCADKVNTSDAGQTIYGQVSEINGETITIEVGTQKEMERPDSGETDSNETELNKTDTEGNSTGETKNGEQDSSGRMEAGEMPGDGGQPSTLELTGEEQDITVDEDTVIKRQGMGGGMPEDMGEKPDGGEAPSEEKPDGAPDGNAPGGEMPEESQEEITLEDIEEGDTIAVTFDEDGNPSEILVMSAGGMGQQNAVESYSAVEEYTEDTEKDGESITSTGTDESAAHIYEGASAVLKNMTISRTSSDSTGGDNSSFYGVGAAVLNTDGEAYISGSTIDTDAAGGAGIFAYGDGIVYASDTKITT